MRRANWLTAGATGWAGLLGFATWTASGSAPGAAAYLTSMLVYMVGALVCHQKPDRSFHYINAQVPVCARCTGLYVGGLLASWLAVAIARRMSAPVSPARSRWLIASCAVPTLITLGIEWMALGTPSNSLRAAAALPLGAAIAWVLATFGTASPSDEVH